MECLSCGGWAPADPETGYQGDPICPRCAREGWSLSTDGELVSPEQHEQARVLVARAKRRMLRAGLRRRSRGASIG